MSISITENRDCMEAMRVFPDKFFDLAVVDPPYGGGFTEEKNDASAILRGGVQTVNDCASTAVIGGTNIISVNHADVNKCARGGRFAKYADMREQNGRHLGDEVSDIHRGYL